MDINNYKVVHLSFYDRKGGAAIAAYRLHNAMLKYGIQSSVIVFNRFQDEMHIEEFHPNGYFNLVDKVKTYLIADKQYYEKNGKGIYSHFNIGTYIKNNDLLNQADVIYIHWIGRGFFNRKNIQFLLDKGKKVIWFMHDMFPLTGGCHHAFECEHYCDGCIKCDFFKRRYKNTAHKQYLSKKKLTCYDNMYWVAPSKWLYNLAKKSGVVNNKNLYLIPNLISDNFFEIDSGFARKALGISQNKKVILYGADHALDNPYKGYNYFVDVIHKLKDIGINSNQVQILFYGVTKSSEIEKKFPFECVFLGHIFDEYTLNLLYNASDVFVSTSIAENSPLTIQESITCKTPVVAFGVGGISEMIEDEIDGYVIRDFNTYQMAEKIIEVLGKDKDSFKECIHKKWIPSEVLKMHFDLMSR